MVASGALAVRLLRVGALLNRTDAAMPLEITRKWLRSGLH